MFVGLDYHQAFVQMCVLDASGTLLMNRKCANSAAALAHATYVHKLKQSPDKTDWSDARLLADLLRVGYLPKAWLAPASLRQLRHVVHHRQQLAQARRPAKLRVTALLRSERIEFTGSRWTKSWIAAVRSCEALGEQGCWVANQLLDEIEHLQSRITHVESRLAALTQDARFCGVTPRNASIGLKQADAGLVRASNPACVTAGAIANRWVRRHGRIEDWKPTNLDLFPPPST